MRRFEIPLALKARKSYLHTEGFPLSPFLKRLLDRPPSGRLRVVCSPAFALPEGVERGEFWAVTGFDPRNATQFEWERLRRPARLFLPSEAHLKACLSHGIPKGRLRRFPLGFDSRLFHPRAGGSTLLPERKEFRFLFLGNPLFRKGLDILLKAFITEFRPEEKVRLVIKLTHLPKLKKHLSYEIPDLMRRLGGLNRMFPAVTVVSQILPDPDYSSLINACDALVSVNRTYHTALPVLEAMACGLPVIGPDILQGLVPFDGTTGFPIAAPKNLTPIPAGGLFPDSPAGLVDEIGGDALRKTMREVFSDPSRVRKMRPLVSRRAKQAAGRRPSAESLRDAVRETAQGAAGDLKKVTA